jgi:uncharacterized membrane protein
MRNRWITLVGMSTGIFGAGLMYYFDPKQGRRRRRRLNHQLADAGQKTQSGINKAERDIRKLGNNLAHSNGSKRAVAALTSMRPQFDFRNSDAQKIPARIARAVRRSGYSIKAPDSIKAALSNSNRNLSRYRARWITLASAGVVGTGLMYYFDPKDGRSRRSRLNAKFVHAGNCFKSGFSKAGRDIRNRTVGMFASARRLFSFRAWGDEVLAQRVRSQLGRIVSHPGSIEVTAQQGRITLSGPALSHEVGHLLEHIHTIKGVKAIENRLDVHEEAGQIPGLQGAGAQPRRSFFRQASWTPAVRLIAGSAGLTAFVFGVMRRGPFRNAWAATAAAAAGSLVCARSATNLELSRLTGIGARRRAIDVQKTIRINAPVQQVFAVWSDFENFPTFMSHVRQVRRLDERSDGNYWRWTVDGPAGTEVEFDTAIAAFEEDQLLAWRTDSSSLVKHVGRVSFTGNRDGSTTAEVRMSYNPIAGALGHAVAKFFGADPKQQMNDDLARLKTYLETGRPAHDAAQSTGTQSEMTRRVRGKTKPAGEPRPH